MKKGICLIERLYVPYGQTVRFETLRVDKLIVDGSLIVKGKISAVICRGKGSVQVGDMEVDKLRLSSVTCEGRLKAREVISRRVYAESVHISKRIWCLISLVAKYLVAPCGHTTAGMRKWGPSGLRDRSSAGLLAAQVSQDGLLASFPVSHPRQRKASGKTEAYQGSGHPGDGCPGCRKTDRTDRRSAGSADLQNGASLGPTGYNDSGTGGAWSLCTLCRRF